MHANLLSWLWIPSQLSIDDVPLYRLSAAATAEEPIRVGWLGERSLHTLSGYKSQGAADDYLENAFDAYPLARHWTRYLTPGFNNSVLPVQERAGFRLWRPAQQGYKQLIHRTQQGTFVDQSVQRQYAQPDVAFESIRAGRLSVPTDPFGGVYLLTRQAPEARLAAFGVLDAPILSTFDPAAQLLLAEVWALDHHQWAYVPGWSFLLAALTALVPWWVLGRVTRLWLWSGLLVLANGALLLVLLRQVQVLYPLTVPLLSTGLAWLWMKRGLLYRQQWALLTTQYREVTGLWLGHLLDEGKPDAALRYLSEQDPSRWSSELWQLVARGFERSRHYNQAVDCYRTILTFEPLNGPAKRQLKQLTELIDGTRTLALGQGKGELPVGQVENLSLGRYRISIELGRGAMGVVYQAEDPKIHRQVALKVVHLKSLGLDEVEQVKERFFREAQAAGKLNHPNIVTVYDVGEEHDVAYIAMDLLIGKPLSFYVPTHGPIDLVKMVRWAAQAADALGYAHDHEVIHRDVKPANMIIEDRDGRLKLTDFGIARIAGAGQTQTGIVLGSPSYMSPEQIRGETLTGKTDIFSLGVTLYQCITGKLPFTGETLPALAYAITQGKLESPRALNTDVPVSLVRIVNKMLHKDVTERYATAGDLAYSLNRWISDHK
ncbi:serine/threonine-protein kinase [Reinekea sp.]|uniref:serine/threonine-protein kinase n=1 Tax=Reinekea sp. TaxID=1970455 RepID=UPI002A81E1B7|nr:serine/threonine-protein kinase [Reinekea sp.]